MGAGSKLSYLRIASCFCPAKQAAGPCIDSGNDLASPALQSFITSILQRSSCHPCSRERGPPDLSGNVKQCHCHIMHRYVDLVLVLQGGWRPEANTLGVDAATLDAPAASRSAATASPSVPAEGLQLGVAWQAQRSPAQGPFAGPLEHMGGALQQLQGFAMARLPWHRPHREQ